MKDFKILRYVSKAAVLESAKRFVALSATVLGFAMLLVMLLEALN